MSTATVFKKNPGFVGRQIAGELVLIPVEKELRKVNCIYSMNAVGSQVWDLIDGEKSTETIRENLLEKFDVKENQLDKDLTEIFDQLQEIKAIVSA